MIFHVPSPSLVCGSTFAAAGCQVSANEHEEALQVLMEARRFSMHFQAKDWHVISVLAYVSCPWKTLS